MLSIVVQPPAQARPGVPLYPPVAARIRSERSIFEELSQIWAAATLIDYSGEALDGQLSGEIADSTHLFPEATARSSTSNNKDRAYIYFPDLTTVKPRYKHIIGNRICMLIREVCLCKGN